MTATYGHAQGVQVSDLRAVLSPAPTTPDLETP